MRRVTASPAGANPLNHVFVRGARSCAGFANWFNLEGMREDGFCAWLKNRRGSADRHSGTISSRLANCRTVERYEGDLDRHFDLDRLQGLRDRLRYSIRDERQGNPASHKVPIRGNIRNGSATLKSAVTLYKQFRESLIEGSPVGAASSKQLNGSPIVQGRLVHSTQELDALENQVIAAAKRTVTSLLALLTNADPLDALAKMKFELSGFHPTDDRSLNLIEQINQTFTYLASARAARLLLQLHPKAAPFRLNLGTASGADIESVDGSVVAETFASVDPQNNRKLATDIEKVKRTNARHKYVFYISPKHDASEPAYSSSSGDVRIVSLGWKRPLES